MLQLGTATKIKIPLSCTFHLEISTRQTSQLSCSKSTCRLHIRLLCLAGAPHQPSSITILFQHKRKIDIWSTDQATCSSQHIHTFAAVRVPNRWVLAMPSAQDIASKLAHITGLLNAGGTNAQMKEWYEEYKKLRVELEQARALQTKDAKAN